MNKFKFTKVKKEKFEPQTNLEGRRKSISAQKKVIKIARNQNKHKKLKNYKKLKDTQKIEIYQKNQGFYIALKNIDRIEK